MEVESGKFVPAENIIMARELNDNDRQELEQKGYNLSKHFQSSVETTGGMILSTKDAATILERRAFMISQAQDAQKRSSNGPGGAEGPG